MKGVQEYLACKIINLAAHEGLKRAIGPQTVPRRRCCTSVSEGSEARPLVLSCTLPSFPQVLILLHERHIQGTKGLCWVAEFSEQCRNINFPLYHCINDGYGGGMALSFMQDWMSRRRFLY
jgi:hypothetical protein